MSRYPASCGRPSLPRSPPNNGSADGSGGGGPHDPSISAQPCNPTYQTERLQGCGADGGVRHAPPLIPHLKRLSLSGMMPRSDVSSERSDRPSPLERSAHADQCLVAAIASLEVEVKVKD